jgi:hypothetical protein
MHDEQNMFTVQTVVIYVIEIVSDSMMALENKLECFPLVIRSCT